MPNAIASYSISHLTVHTNSQATKEGGGQFSKGSPHSDRAETSEPSPLQASTFFQKLQPALSEKTYRLCRLPGCSTGQEKRQPWPEMPAVWEVFLKMK